MIWDQQPSPHIQLMLPSSFASSAWSVWWLNSRILYGPCVQGGALTSAHKLPTQLILELSRQAFRSLCICLGTCGHLDAINDIAIVLFFLYALVVAPSAGL